MEAPNSRMSIGRCPKQADRVSTSDFCGGPIVQGAINSRLGARISIPRESEGMRLEAAATSSGFEHV